MSLEAWFTVTIVGLLFIALVKNLAPPDVIFLAATTVLAVAGIITPEEAFAGFSNTGMLTVAVLFVVVAGLRETGVLDYIGQHLLGKSRTERGVLLRLSGVVLPLSAFLNNTPIVAMFMPVVLDWSRRNQVSPSRLLIPLSYLAILGGTCTLIGTSTNLVINGLMIENGIPGLSLFEIARIGIPYAVIGIAYLFVTGSILLPERKELLEQLGESRREFLAEMQIQAGCRLIGQTIEQGGLRQLPGLFLIEIDRNGQIIAPALPDQRLELHDRLIFTGIISSIIELEKIPQLVPVADPDYEVSPRKQRRRRLCEAVISENSPLRGKTIRDAEFRAVYGAAVVAVHRSGKRVEKKIGDITLQSGDTLLLQTQPHFQRAHRHDPAFYLISDVENWRPLRSDRAWIAVSLLLMLILLMTTGVMPIVLSATLTAVLMVALGCISAGDARQSVEWQVLITIAAAFGVGTALQNSGAATVIAASLVEATREWGPIAAIAVIYLLGSIMTELITNNAAAVLMFPFCLETARLYQASPLPFLMTLILSASASFMTPIGYQTNMMVYGPGGYRFTDFLRIGTPLNLLLWIVAVVMIPWIWPF
ncbi:SLC13 family permease [Gimesia sp.]|uniref:SLC13 family permease n=1 Tax=Gimesia sp. TaxID=2024833 RepID=UPI000C47DA4F|nr:SLC13 family permease [Gimesia sp.]MAX40704.1 SLC13 family permease [Gimesia sp.]|tara:strand:+ start:11046 stop:12821 length:1776 start_codon:yes stop_codon:yes gene_type:complete